ncbi:hypothetical protein FRB98_002117, partial [Tulasnella sp. 332]
MSNPNTSAQATSARAPRPSLGHRASTTLSHLVPKKVQELRDIPAKDIPAHLSKQTYAVTRVLEVTPWWSRVYFSLYIAAIFGVAVLIVVACELSEVADYVKAAKTNTADIPPDATQGYEPKAILSSDYNLTQRFWYSAFTPWLSPGSLCDAHLFSVGDSFQASVEILLDFLTNTETVVDSSLSVVNNQGLNYTGRPLLPGTCTPSSLQIVADLTSWTVTAYAVSSMDANRLFGIVAPNSGVEVENKWAAQVLLEIAGLDILTTLRMNLNILGTSVTSFSVRWLAQPSDPPCYNSIIPFQIDTVGFSNMSLSMGSAAEELFDTIFYNTTSNFMQTMMAAVNIDIGNPCPSFMTQPSMTPDVLSSTPNLQDNTAAQYLHTVVTAYKTFFNTVNSPNAFLELNYGFTFPLYAIDYVYIDAAYLCHLSVRKGVLSLIVAIITATYSLFMSSWATAMIVVYMFAPKKPENSNYCEGHVILEEKMNSRANSPDGSGGRRASDYFQAMALPQNNIQMPTPEDDAAERGKVPQ